jgi:hypothetical protein
MKKREIKSLYVYIITNLILNKQYVGSRVCYIDNPCEDEYMGSSKYLNEDIDKFGKENFTKEILEFCNDKVELFNAETDRIIKYNTLYPNGYNRFFPNKRKGFYRLGIKHTEETLNKLRRPKSEEHKKHLSESRKGIKISEEARLRLKESGFGKGEKNSMYGRSIYSCWLEKFGKEIADKKLEEYSKKFIGRSPTNKGDKGVHCWVYKLDTRECTQIKTSDLEIFLNDGWIKGNLYNSGKKGKRDKSKIKYGKDCPTYNTVWINNSDINKRVKKDNLNEWINNGWIKGVKEETIKNLIERTSGEKNPMYGKCFINNGNSNKVIKKEELESWINQGWKRGMKKR